MEKPDRVKLLETMLLIRRFEEKLEDLSKEQGKLHGMMIVCTGQEAVAAGVSAALEPQDVIISNHRSHGHLIAKGAEPDLIMAEIYGKRTGYNKGKSGTLHIAAPEVNALCTTTVVGGGIPIAVGTAFAAQYEQKDFVTVCYFGNGATDEGSFHEALNLAALWSLPVIFVCENNVYSGAQRQEEHTRVKDLAHRAVAYGMASEVVDGNDVLKVYEATARARAKCLAGEGPILIECKTYRWGGHSTTDQQVYQPKEEIEQWKQRCPIEKLKKELLAAGILSETAWQQMNTKVNQLVDKSVQFAEESPWPDVTEALEDVFA
ncbi:thiamine pyrophosphate-dependent dehydrogenase E1 component subunit alpha [Desulforamulus ferrireducens]|uniref:Pyruvate dehydrogenase (Acetyl-transferring) E1 component subunit alpha n=1 Tax=Desulforamulus ferrireducens TaxID=1833852 RepID=A0A1S6ISP9_9FIRM|nr:thiamine pyrophosphate-dependent dehydrogenase E1 component subunit alpha [Desulforamulus ferrireducens]AQS57798.1 pyruvate dehydrogenase (acetyl-transferring) E1 component subunit alpha [Desulforamulus ferrireducens]